MYRNHPLTHTHSIGLVFVVVLSEYQSFKNVIVVSVCVNQKSFPAFPPRLTHNLGSTVHPHSEVVSLFRIVNPANVCNI